MVRVIILVFCIGTYGGKKRLVLAFTEKFLSPTFFLIN